MNDTSAMGRTNPRRLTLIVSLLCVFAAACGDDGRVDDPDGSVHLPDTDGDTISDRDEGSSSDVDSDSDGTPDFRDSDSDNDGIFDHEEAGDDDLATPPVDSDADGIPDFQDFDSDNNGLPDAREGIEDTDGDGTLDYADEDDDDDGLRDEEELMGRFDFPRDGDDDGVPDFRDPDSDNDTILDGTEGYRDTDGDGVPDLEDADSDGDGISDLAEAGDDDLRTPPVDTDGDRTPDYRDRDSDNDGLSDALEVEAGTDPLRGDSDDDGVSDLIEVGAGTDALDPADNPRANGDFVFLVPYDEPARPARDTLEFRTNVQLADVYFMFDVSGSMSQEIRATRDAYVEIVERLTCEDYGISCSSVGDCEFAPPGAICSTSGRCIEDPETAFCVSDLWTGVGTYEDPGTYANLLSLQEVPMRTQNAFPTSTSGGNEALYESIACVADPTTCSGAGCTPGGIGCPSFRNDAIRMLITVTDEDNQCTSCSPATPDAAGRMLLDRQILFAGINAATGSAAATAQTDLEAIATAADSYAGDGLPLVFPGNADTDPAQLIESVTGAVNEVVRNVGLYVTIDPSDAPDDAGNSLQFIDHLETNITRPGCSIVDELADVNPMDGYTETFPALLPGRRVCWDLVVRPNRTVPPTAEPQLFIANLTVTGNGSPLDRRQVFFLVPPDPNLVDPLD